jgi:UDP-N-acetylmuramate: L-alanyl-gamma-D-glutamyl-meso-diaminopimelate ligase
VALGVPAQEAADALAGFRGVRRRQEVRGTERGVTVLDDFAHHPTAVRETIAAMRMRYPGRRIVAVLEPRSNTSRRALFQHDFIDALLGADRSVVAIVPHEPIYSATGEVTQYLDAERIAASLREADRDAVALAGADAIVEHLAATSASGDVVLVMSNGDFGGVWGKLLAKLREAP